MKKTDYNVLLYEKAKAEQDRYKEWLLSQLPEEILDHAYEYSVREDIVMYMEYAELTPERAKALLKSPCIVDDIYRDLYMLDINHMEDIRYCTEERADKLISRNLEKESR